MSALWTPSRVPDRLCGVMVASPGTPKLIRLGPALPADMRIVAVQKHAMPTVDAFSKERNDQESEAARKLANHPQGRSSCDIARTPLTMATANTSAARIGLNTLIGHLGSSPLKQNGLAGDIIIVRTHRRTPQKLPRRQNRYQTSFNHLRI